MNAMVNGIRESDGRREGASERRWFVSVVVCAYTMDRWDDLGAAIRSLRSQTVPASEVIVVIDDNAELYARASNHLDGVTVVLNSRSKGLSGARNTGVATARGDLVAFLDDDATAAPTWIEHMCAHFDREDVGGVGSAVIPNWVSGRPGWFPDEFLWVVGCSYRGMPEEAALVRNPIGAGMVMRREVFEAVGGFSEALGRVGNVPVGCEETELCIRAGVMGYKIIFEPAAQVSHRVPGTRAALRYFVRRCRAEGRSKAVVTFMSASGDDLATERSYVRRVLSRGIWEALRQAAKGPERSQPIRRAGAICVGLGCTAWGYGTARARGVSRAVASESKGTRTAAGAVGGRR